MQYLSPHFTLDELTVTQQRGIDNTPPPDVLASLKRTALGLEMIRTRLAVPIIVTSGYRSPEVNAAVGGARNSQHMRGEAVDFIAPRFGAPNSIVSALIDSWIGFDQLIVEFDRWVHVSFSDRPRGEVLRIDKAGTRPFA